MKEKELNIQDIERHLRKLGFEEKSSYLSQVCPPDTATFPGQTIGQYLFSRVCAVNDKFHTNTEEKPRSEFIKEHNISRDNLLILAVGKDYFPHYMQQLEELREKRCHEIMDSTPHLYHFSQITPNKFGPLLIPHLKKPEMLYMKE